MTSRPLHRCCAALTAGLLAGAAGAEPPNPTTAGDEPAAIRGVGCDSQPQSSVACPGFSLPIEDAPGLPDDLVRPAPQPAGFDFSLKLPPDTDTSSQSAPFEVIDLSAELADLPFRDREPLVNRLRSIQALPFFTLWDSSGATLYVGIDRKGSPGLHLRQKGHSEGAVGLSAAVNEPAPEAPEVQPTVTVKAPTEPVRAKTLPAGRR